MEKNYFFDVCSRCRSEHPSRPLQRFEDLETAMSFAKAIADTVPYYSEVTIVRYDVEIVETVKSINYAGE